MGFRDFYSWNNDKNFLKFEAKEFITIKFKMKRKLTLFLLMMYFQMNCQISDSIFFIRNKGSYWSLKKQISEKIVLIVDSNKNVRFNFYKYRIKMKKSTKQKHFYDTICKIGTIDIDKMEVNNVLFYIDSSIEKDNIAETKNLILNASFTQLQKSLKVKNWKLNYDNYYKNKLDKDDFVESKKDIYIDEYIKYLTKNKKSFSFTTDVSNSFTIVYKKNNKNYTIRQDFLDDMGQPYYVFKEEDSNYMRYINIETNFKFKKILNVFKNFKVCIDEKQYLNAYLSWYLKNGIGIKIKNRKKGSYY
jgi:hypothetical protein